MRLPLGTRIASAAVLVLACGAEPKAVLLGGGDTGATAALEADTLLTLRLPARTSTGYGWQVDRIDPSVLTLIDREQESPGGVGGDDLEVLRFGGVAAGHTALVLSYRQPWAAPAASDPVYAVDVDVAGPYAGPYAARVVRAAPRVALLGAAPAHLDLCDPGDGSHGKCTPVKSQGACGGCWAFATVGVVENLLHLDDPAVTPDLSEQYLISCNTQGWTCAGGGFIAFDYFIDRMRSPPETAAGAVYEADFPFQAADVSCGSAAHPHHERLASWGSIGAGATLDQRVAAIKQAILDHGPVWASICADNAFQGWKPTAGTFQGDGCTTVNHAVVLTGWDDASGAWILRNSWGAGWGENGYMRIAWGANAVAADAAYAVLAAQNDPPPPTRTSIEGARGVTGGCATGAAAAAPWAALAALAVLARRRRLQPVPARRVGPGRRG
jgi:inhibitor of cysteine peptidase